jgi:hypothetical protein
MVEGDLARLFKAGYGYKRSQYDDSVTDSYCLEYRIPFFSMLSGGNSGNVSSNERIYPNVALRAFYICCCVLQYGTSHLSSICFAEEGVERSLSSSSKQIHDATSIGVFLFLDSFLSFFPMSSYQRSFVVSRLL